MQKKLNMQNYSNILISFKQNFATLSLICYVNNKIVSSMFKDIKDKIVLFNIIERKK